MDYTTVDDFGPIYNTEPGDSTWTTVGDTKLLKAGWKPGEKHSFGQNLLRVLSFGAYNPDDRDASAINKEILKKHGLNQEQRDMLEKQQMAEMIQDAHTYQRAHPDVTFEAAMMEVANNRAAQMLAKTAEFEAAQSLAGLNKTESDAAKPGASDVVRSSQQATISSNDTNNERNKVLRQRYRGQNATNLGSQQALNDTTAEDMRGAQNRLAMDRMAGEQTLMPFQNQYELDKVIGANSVLNEEEGIRQSNAANRARAARAAAATTADQATAMQKIMGNPHTAEAVVTGQINRGASTAVPADATLYAPLPMPGSPIEGLRRERGVTPYTTVDRDAEGNVIGIRQRVPGGATPTADMPAPGTPLSGAPVIKLSPDELIKFRPR